MCFIILISEYVPIKIIWDHIDRGTKKYDTKIHEMTILLMFCIRYSENKTDIKKFFWH